MQNSLNQAFIRAYAKERDANSAHAANQASEAQAAAQRVNEQLIMRIDTATVDIPQPHLATRPLVRQAATVSASTSKAAAAERPARPQRTEEDELRATIASEMLRAGGWQSEQIAALGPISPAGFANRSEPADADEIPSRPTLDRHAPRGRVDHDQDAETETFEPAYDQSALRASSSTDAPRYPDREPATREPMTNQPVPEFMQHVKSGSIVRLDRPFAEPAKSQSATTAPASKPAAATTPVSNEKYAEQRFDTEETREDFQPTISIQDAVQYHRKPTNVASAAQAVERELRRAKVRVFNPTWEVDQLQWPDVCVKLMEARMNSLTHVTKHLIEACQEGLQVLAVTSPEGGEGRTTVACCLAMLAGSRGLKVAIVDGDIENPTLCVQTNLEIENDWQSAIVNEMPLEEVAVHSIDDQITLLPLVSPLDETELPKTDQRIANMLVELGESFDLVILDVGHMSSPNGLMQTLAEQGVINAAIAVVDHRNASTQRTELCIRRIRQAGVTSIGLVENFAA